jgi:hypothetical protein
VIEPTCLGVHIECGTMFKGAGAVVMAFILFYGSIYVLLAAVFGRWMGYLVVAASFFGWMAILSSLWLFAFYAQGPDTPTNNGPRGQEPAWVPLEGGLDAVPVRYETFASYPGDPWSPPNPGQSASVESVTAIVQGFLAEQANEELGLLETDPDAVQSTQFTVPENRMRFAADGKVSLAVAQGYFNGGGPLTTVSLYHDSGSVPRYSYMFLGGSILLFGLHLPLLDRAEKKRKEFLTGGNAPPWYGPA